MTKDDTEEKAAKVRTLADSVSDVVVFVRDVQTTVAHAGWSAVTKDDSEEKAKVREWCCANLREFDAIWFSLTQSASVSRAGWSAVETDAPEEQKAKVKSLLACVVSCACYWQVAAQPMPAGPRGTPEPSDAEVCNCVGFWCSLRLLPMFCFNFVLVERKYGWWCSNRCCARSGRASS